MNINQTLISSSNDDDSHRHIDESVHQSAADEVSFTFNHLQYVQIDSNDNPQKLTPDSSPSSGDNDTDQLPDPDDSVHQSATDEVSFTFTNLQIDRSDDSISKKLVPESSETDVEDPNEEENVENDYENDNEEEEDDGDFTFTFACVDNDNNNDFDLRNTEVSEGQIRNVFPLFDQSLLLTSEYNNAGKRRLPIDVPVNNVFIESPPQPRSPSGEPETDGTIRSLSEMNTKSNSTGFSKLWRFRDEMNRSNSDGRDAFVFLETPETEFKRSTATDFKRSMAAALESTSQKVNAGEGKGKGKGKDVKKGLKVKKSTPSAHEVYLKKKGGRTEEERRRSYLPYRAGLMGFFTNVNGGLSKNVHPF